MLEDTRTEQALERALASPDLERLLVRVLESRLVDDLTERLLESPELQRVIEHVAASPDLLEAVSHHTETLAEEMVADVRRSTQRVDDVAERTVARGCGGRGRALLSEAPVPYAGIATRAIGLAMDVGIAQVIVFAGGAVLALVASIVDMNLTAALPPCSPPSHGPSSSASTSCSSGRPRGRRPACG